MRCAVGQKKAAAEVPGSPEDNGRSHGTLKTETQPALEADTRDALCVQYGDAGHRQSSTAAFQFDVFNEQRVSVGSPAVPVDHIGRYGFEVPGDSIVILQFCFLQRPQTEASRPSGTQIDKSLQRCFETASVRPLARPFISPFKAVRGQNQKTM